MSVKIEFTAVLLERWEQNFSFQLLLLSKVASISIRKILKAENQRKIFCKLEEVSKRKQTSLNIAMLTAKRFKKINDLLYQRCLWRECSTLLRKPKGTETQISWFGMQCPLRMPTICNRVNVIGALRGRAGIQDAIIHCHCHGSLVERCCSENHLRASLESHELIHGLE